MNTSEKERLESRISFLEEELARSHMLTNIGLELARHRELAELMPVVMRKVSEILQADRTTLFLYDEHVSELWTMVGEGLEINEIRLPAGQGIAGHVANSRRVLNVPDAYELDFFDRSWDSKTGYRTRSVLCIPMLRRQGELLGVLQVLNKKDNDVFNSADEGNLRSLAAQISPHVENADLQRRIHNVFEAVVNAISVALDGRDPVTAGHSRRVTEYGLAIARAIHHSQEPVFREVSFTRNQMRELRYAGLLHDFGKVGVPESVLQKGERLPTNWIHVIEERLGRLRVEHMLECLRQDGAAEDADGGAQRLEDALGFLVKLNTAGFLSDEASATLDEIFTQKIISEMEHSYLSIPRGTLTSEEREVMESHVVKTEAVLSVIPWPENMSQIPAIAATHHECPNGKGYPNHLCREEIPLLGLVLAVADVYDALTAQDRPYKPAIPHEKSAAILRSMAAEERLDSDIVELFLEQKLYELSQSEHDNAYLKQVEEAISRDSARFS